MKKVVAIMAHPDDEVLGCGATLSRLSREGFEIHIFILATGITSRDQFNNEDINLIKKHSKLASKFIGAKSIQFDSFPDNQMDTVPLLKVIKKIETFLELTNPDLIFTHHSDDVNIDHFITQKAVLAASRSLPNKKLREIYASEILSSSEYGKSDRRIRPDTYFVISDIDVQNAIDAMKCYNNEIREWPHPRSIEAMEHSFRLRGSECGFSAAEVFEVIRVTK